jgi:hypothetical protein
MAARLADTVQDRRFVEATARLTASGPATRHATGRHGHRGIRFLSSITDRMPNGMEERKVASLHRKSASAIS